MRVILNVSTEDKRVRFECVESYNVVPFTFKLEPSMCMRALFEAFCRSQLTEAVQLFFFDGDLIATYQTPSDLELRDSDVVIVIVGHDPHAIPGATVAGDGTWRGSALMAACHDNNARRVRKLLRAGWNPNDYWMRGDGLPLTALSVALEMDADVQLIRSLLDARGNPNVIINEESQTTPLEAIVSGNRHAQLVWVLMRAGADPGRWAEELGGLETPRRFNHRHYPKGQNLAQSI